MGGVSRSPTSARCHYYRMCDNFSMLIDPRQLCTDTYHRTPDRLRRHLDQLGHTEMGITCCHCYCYVAQLQVGQVVGHHRLIISSSTTQTMVFEVNDGRRVTPVADLLSNPVTLARRLLSRSSPMSLEV